MFACVGGLSTIVQTFNVIYPGSHKMGGIGVLIGIIVISLSAALFKEWRDIRSVGITNS